MSIEDKVENYKKTLELFPNDQEKYQYLIEQAKESTEFPQELRQDSFKVNVLISWIAFNIFPKPGEAGSAIRLIQYDIFGNICMYIYIFC